MIELITTSDGSHSLLNTQLQETYHSVHGAIQESKHVFIKEGLVRVSREKEEVRILEIGFGTGLNALLTWMFAEENKIRVVYESWEIYPLDQVIVEKLNYGKLLNRQTHLTRLHSAPWNEWTALSTEITLLKRKGNIVADTLSIQSPFDLIYYDAFGPAKQPEMWGIEVLRKVAGSLSEGGIWVTYCAKGQVKRDLRSLGLLVETVPGPPGKKEMTRAIRS